MIFSLVAFEKRRGYNLHRYINEVEKPSVMLRHNYVKNTTILN